jgi:peptide/nickel transport system permease protein
MAETSGQTDRSSADKGKQENLRRLFWKRFRKNRLAMAGAFIVAVLFAVALLAPYLSPYDPGAINIKIVLQEPSAEHPFGTDALGRDVLSRMIWGSRISLLVGFVAVGIASLIGIFLGALAGYYGRWVDNLIMRFVDIMLCFPTFFLILAVVAFLEPSIWNIMIIIGITGWMGVARLVRAEFLSLKERDFTKAERALGARDFRIIFKHILPNALAPVLVSATLGVAGAILTESALSFLGIGVQPPTPSWGNILTAGKDNIEIAWWLSLYPGLAILITVLGYNLLGEGIRDAIDPRLKQ